jgi:hypothetical protein
MKKLFAIAAIAAVMISCNDEKKTETTEGTGADSVAMDANQMSNMADSATNMMNKVADSATTAVGNVVDSAKAAVEKAGKEANKMMDKATEKMEEKKP